MKPGYLQHKINLGEKYEVSFKRTSHESGLFLYGKWNDKILCDSLESAAEAIAKKVDSHTDPSGPDNIQLVKAKENIIMTLTYLIRPSWAGGDPRWNDYNQGRVEKDYLHARIRRIISVRPEGLEKKVE
jgi:hypothetical protein